MASRCSLLATLAGLDSSRPRGGGRRRLRQGACLRAGHDSSRVASRNVQRLGGSTSSAARLWAIMAKIVHRPAVFDDQKRYPFGVVLGQEYPCPKNQRNGFYHPEDPVEGLFVAGLGFIVGNVSKKLSHGVIFPRMANPSAAICEIIVTHDRSSFSKGGIFSTAFVLACYAFSRRRLLP